jgi:addiction module RelE/StbE family toxin
MRSLSGSAPRPEPWSIIATPTFKRNYKKIDREVQRRIETAIKDLAESPDPRKAGHGLHGLWAGLHSLEVGRRYRLIYKVDFEKHTIQLIAVGTHKIYRE